MASAFATAPAGWAIWCRRRKSRFYATRVGLTIRYDEAYDQVVAPWVYEGLWFWWSLCPESDSVGLCQRSRPGRFRGCGCSRVGLEAGKWTGEFISWRWTGLLIKFMTGIGLFPSCKLPRSENPDSESGENPVGTVRLNICSTITYNNCKVHSTETYLVDTPILKSYNLDNPVQATAPG